MNPLRLTSWGPLWPLIRSVLIPLAMAAVAVGLLVLFPRDGGSGSRRSFPVTTPGPVGGASFKVYLSGAVQQPGVYTVRDGDRVDDVLRLAGGPAPDADLSAVNLALRLKDAQQVAIPRASGIDAQADNPRQGSQINLNTATQAVLETLPDIGEVRARRIVESRTRDGPFQDPHDLVGRQIITDGIFSKLRDRVTVR